MKKLLICAFAITGLSAISSADGLTLQYVEGNLGGGLHSYTFTLGVDTGGAGWHSGMGWDWFIFGDAPYPNSSPMADFAMTSSFPVGPWTYLTSSGGGHNGPTFGPVTGAYWVPTSSSQTLTWSGTSHYDANGGGGILFSELVTEGGAVGDSFKPATSGAPEPASFLALGGVAVLFLRKRRISK